jgi:hypothetical protein
VDETLGVFYEALYERRGAGGAVGGRVCGS